MKTIYYCIDCENEYDELYDIDETYNNVNSDDNLVSIEHHGMCQECKVNANHTYQSNWDYHMELRV